MIRKSHVTCDVESMKHIIVAMVIRKSLGHTYYNEFPHNNLVHHEQDDYRIHSTLANLNILLLEANTD